MIRLRQSLFAGIDYCRISPSKAAEYNKSIANKISMNAAKVRKELTSEGWGVSRELFGNAGADIYDFMMFNYVFFLNSVKSVTSLLQGLSELSPFADDAIAIARTWSVDDFLRFKAELAKERSGSNKENPFPEEWPSVLIPERLLRAQSIAGQFDVPLGTALVRLTELEVKGF